MKADCPSVFSSTSEASDAVSANMRLPAFTLQICHLRLVPVTGASPRLLFTTAAYSISFEELTTQMTYHERNFTLKIRLYLR
jgi:hypothetical protein